MRRQLRFVAPLALAATLVPAVTIAADSDAELAEASAAAFTAADFAVDAGATAW